MKRLSFLFATLLFFCLSLDAQQYYPSASYISTSGNGYLKRWNYTFAGRQDTVYFYSHGSPNDPTLNPPRNILAIAPNDTVNAAGAMYITSVDSFNVQWDYQFTSDTSKGWTTRSLEVDSSATANSVYTIDKFTQCRSSVTNYFASPFGRLRAIGKAPAGGKQNKVGVKIQVDIIK